MKTVPTIEVRFSDIDAVTEARFWQMVQIDFRPGACWTWKGMDTQGGYGRFKINGHRVSANRVAFAIEHGITPTGVFICHTCDNPACVRLDHLFAGSPLDNARDRGRKRRHAHGSRSGTAILTEVQVLEIDRELSIGSSPGSLAGRYGVSRRTIQKIKSRANWRHLFSHAESAARIANARRD